MDRTLIPITDARSIKEAVAEVEKGIRNQVTALEQLQAAIILPENAHRRDTMTELIIDIQKAIGKLKREQIILERKGR